MSARKIRHTKLRPVYNGMIAVRQLIARCVDVADVVAAVNFARQRTAPGDTAAATAATGHCTTCDDGLVIDLGLMKGSGSILAAAGCWCKRAAPGAISTTPLTPLAWRRRVVSSRPQGSPA
ncbi:MAG: hypothetical protein M9927_11465 [Anaerolineae bacterium]|nr:hypothetical protein [Anaerolineae bacterium]